VRLAGNCHADETAVEAEWQSECSALSSLNYEVVLFDLDDTLIDRRGAFMRAAREMYASYPALQLKRSAEAVVRLLVDWENEGGPPALTAAMLREWPAIGLPADRLWTVFRNRLFGQIHPDQAVIDLVTDLRTAGAQTGVITNGDARQLEKFTLAGLTGLFDVVLVSEVVGIRKPAAAIFEMALNKLGASNDSAIFIGDNPPVDIEGARTAGLATAWVRAGREWPAALERADFEVDSVAELRSALFSRD
jgi:putative hydrolase of the HAD superfamily